LNHRLIESVIIVVVVYYYCTEVCYKEVDIEAASLRL